MSFPRRRWRCLSAYGLCLLYAMLALDLGPLAGAVVAPAEAPPPPLPPPPALASFSVLNHAFRIGVFIFLSAVFAGLTLGVMTIDTFTLEIIAESGRAPDCRHAAQILPLRKDAHATLCTLIISNMLCNVLVVQEFRAIVTAFALAGEGGGGPAAEPAWRTLWEFAGSTVLVVVTELVPMAVCKSKYSLRVAAWGAIFVQFARILTYPVSMPLGKFLDWVVGGKERGQIYDRNELRRLMVVQYERKGSNKMGMSKAELDLLLSAMDFQESRVRDIMQPFDKITYIHEGDFVTPDFIAQLWLSGRSRVPVMSENGSFDNVLVVKDLLTANIDPAAPTTRVAEVVKEKNRPLVMVESGTALPAMLRIFQDLKTHMAMVFCENDSRDSVNSVSHVHKVIGLVTLEDVVEKLLNEEIYDEYDRYGVLDGEGSALSGAIIHPLPSSSPLLPLLVSSASSTMMEEELPNAPLVPVKHPRVNFYSYFTHPEANIPLTNEQVWAVAFFLQRTISSFSMWEVEYIKMLLDSCQDQQLVPPSYLAQERITSHSSTVIAKKEPFEERSVLGGSLRSQSVSSLSSDKKPSSFNSNIPLQMMASHSQFLSRAEEEKFILYKKGVCSTNFTLVLGGQVELLVGDQTFSTRIYSFCHLGEEALGSSLFTSIFSAVVVRPARIYSISKELYDTYASYQLAKMQAAQRRSPPELSRQHGPLKSLSFPNHKILSENSRSKKDFLLLPSVSPEVNLICDQKAYGTFNK